MNDIVRIQGIKTAILFRYKFNGMPLLLGHVTLWGISQKTIFGPPPHPINFVHGYHWSCDRSARPLACPTRPIKCLNLTYSQNDENK